MSAVLKMIDGDASGRAADTGSAVHMAARAFHTVANGDVRTSVAVMREALSQYPLADLDDAAEQFLRYAADKRNQGVTFALVEAHVRFSLDPAPEDPTQEKIAIIGTVDQVRVTRYGELELWDIKTGRQYEGPDMVNAAAMQLAAYQWAASQLLDRPVRFAGIIRTQDYFKRTTGLVFHQANWHWARVPALLDAIRHTVADVRAGRISASPGAEACKWCVGLGSCLDRLEGLK